MDKDLLKELQHKHRQIKREILEIAEKANDPNYNKQYIADRLMKLYTLVK